MFIIGSKVRIGVYCLVTVQRIDIIIKLSSADISTQL